MSDCLASNSESLQVTSRMVAESIDCVRESALALYSILESSVTDSGMQKLRGRVLEV